MSIQLAKNFTRGEFERAGDAWPAALEPHVKRMATLAQWLRDLIDAPMIVTSYYRSPARNAAVGGAQNSQHMSGDAMDFTTRVSHDEILRRVRQAVELGNAPLFGQMIFYRDTGHVHFSQPHTNGRPNYEMYWADTEAGARKYTLIDRLKAGISATVAAVTESPGISAGALIVGALVLWAIFARRGA